MGQRRGKRPTPVPTKPPRPKVPRPAPLINDPFSPLVAAGVMLVAAVVYVQTAARDIVVGDNAEFATIALSGGVAHPPGYPLLLLLARLFSWLPFGTPVFRVNLVSVAAGVATAGLIVLTARRLGASRAGAAIAGLVVAFQPVVWEWSLAIEAFTLNAVLASAIVYFLVRWHQQPERTQFLVLAALFGGLASSNHHTIVFLIPSIVLLLWWHRDRLVGRPKVIAACVAAIIAGLLPYGYLLWESAKDPLLNWGNVRTFGQLVSHFLRADYGTTSLATLDPDTGSPLARLIPFAASFTVLEGALLSVGAFVAYRVSRWYFWFVLLCFTLAGPALIAFANMDVANRGGFFVLPHVILAPLVGLGFTYAAEWLARTMSSTKRQLPELALGAAAVGLIAITVARHYRQIDQRDNHLARTFGEDILASLPPQTVLMALDDQIVLPVAYLQAVEKKRPDVTLVMLELFRGADGTYISQMRRRHPDLTVPFNQYSRFVPYSNTKAFIDANPGRIFAMMGSMLDSSLLSSHWLYQRGLVNMIMPMATDVGLDQAEVDFQRLMSMYRLPDPQKVKLETYERRILSAYAQPFLWLARQYGTLGRKAEADSLINRAAQIEPAIAIQAGIRPP